MGSLLCCFRVADVGEGAENSDSLVSRHCICLRCLTQQLSHAVCSSESSCFSFCISIKEWIFYYEHFLVTF